MMTPLNITIVYADDGSIIGSDEALAYESYYCDKCTNQKPDEDGGCPAYILLVTYGLIAGLAKEQGVQDILRLFFPPHPTVEGKLNQCRMFIEKPRVGALQGQAFMEEHCWLCPLYEDHCPYDGEPTVDMIVADECPERIS